MKTGLNLGKCLLAIEPSLVHSYNTIIGSDNAILDSTFAGFKKSLPDRDYVEFHYGLTPVYTRLDTGECTYQIADPALSYTHDISQQNMSFSNIVLVFDMLDNIKTLIPVVNYLKINYKHLNVCFIATSISTEIKDYLVSQSIKIFTFGAY